jgi:hypothetical protein
MGQNPFTTKVVKYDNASRLVEPQKEEIHTPDAVSK